MALGFKSVMSWPKNFIKKLLIKAIKKQRDDDCLNKSAKALNDFAAKKIYKNCMDEWEDYVNNKENY